VKVLLVLLLAAAAAVVYAHRKEIAQYNAISKM
jgi:hypothetical protein